MAPSFAELALGSAPKRVTEEHVAALVEADEHAKQQKRERAQRAQRRLERIAREQEQKKAEARGARQYDSAAAGMARVHGTREKR